MNKMLLLVGAGIGYVLGARAGRERYDQIADQANKLWSDPRVQTKVEEVKAKAPEMAHQVGEQARSKVDEAKHRVSGDSSGSGGGSGSTSGDTFQNATGSYDPETGTTTVDTTGFGPGEDKLP